MLTYEKKKKRCGPGGDDGWATGMKVGVTGRWREKEEEEEDLKGVTERQKPT